MATRIPSASAAALAFDAIAERFDDRFRPWQSVAAQRRAVRAELVRCFPPGSRVLELGGGTGEDALWLTERQRQVLLTDASPAMIDVADAKLRAHGAPRPMVLSIEELDDLRARGEAEEGEAPLFDGAFSNFAALNCVADLMSIGPALARFTRPGAPVVLVVFGVCVPGEWLVQLLRGDGRAAFRRFHSGDVPARLGGHAFTVRYHRQHDLVRALAPWFRLQARRGIGVFVPPSAAEPWISRHPRLLRALEALDGVAARRLATFGDHVLYRFERTLVPASERSS